MISNKFQSLLREAFVPEAIHGMIQVTLGPADAMGFVGIAQLIEDDVVLLKLTG